jgi:hypothetical protein
MASRLDAVGRGADQLQADEMVPQRLVIAEENRRAAHGGEHHVKVAIAIHVASGNVGIGGSLTPVAKLEVVGQDALRLIGYQPFMTLYDSDANRYSATRIQNVNGAMVLEPQSFVDGSNPNASVVIANSGNVGIGTSTPVAKLHVEGNAVQAMDKGGFVKAMAYIDPFLPAAQYVVRCYNSQLPGNASSTAPCGITVERFSPGYYCIIFGFNVEERFISLTPRHGSSVVAQVVSANGNEVCVFISVDFRPSTQVDSRFYIIVY